MPKQSLLDEVDGIVREYLSWRGFGNTLQALNTDIREDFYSGLSSKRLVEKLFIEIESLQIDNVFTWWDEGVAPLLLRVEEEVAQIGRSFRDATFRLYLVCCHKNNQPALVLEFFSKHWQSRVGPTRFREEWKRHWFSLPYLPTAPERDRYFQVYFSAEWKTTLFTSLESFLNVIFLALPIPRLVALGNVRDVMEGMRVEIEALKLASEVQVVKKEEQVAVMESHDAIRQPAFGANTASLPLPSPPPSLPSQTIGKRNGTICSVRFSPSCQLVAGCGRDATCVVWPANPNLAPTRTPRLFCNATATCLDWFDDGLICVGTRDHAMHLWRFSAGGGAGVNQITTLKTESTLPHILDCCVHKTMVACSAAPANAALAGEIQIWNAQSERMDRVLPIDPGPTRFTRLQFNHNGSLLVAGAMDGMMRIFDVGNQAGAIMGWQAFPHTGVGAICLSKHETSVYCLNSLGTQVVEYSVHKMGEVMQRFDLTTTAVAASGSNTGAMEIRATLQRLAIVTGSGECHIVPISSLASNSGSTMILNNVSSADWDESALVCGGLDGIVCKYQF